MDLEHLVGMVALHQRPTAAHAHGNKHRGLHGNDPTTKYRIPSVRVQSTACLHVHLHGNKHVYRRQMEDAHGQGITKQLHRDSPSG